MGIAFSNNLGRIIALGLGLTAVSAAGQDQAAGPHWQRLTRVDIDAAQRMLLEDHPGSVEALGDAAFRQRLAAAYAAATARARRVTSSEGYFATLAGFAAAMGDKHIWSRPLLTSGALDWAGIVIARRGNDWVVADENEAVAGEPLAGARLVACDGIPADRLAEQRLGGFRAVWSIGAQRTAVAPLLLTDDGNPFLTRPARCAFEQNGQSREIELRWRNARRNDLNPRFGRAVRRGEAGFGVRRSGDGYWIGLQSLGDQAGPVVEAVRTQAEAIRRAPYVVLDLRGNSGGNSAYGDQIAEALLGGDTLRRVRDGGGNCNTVWRLSDRNLRHLEQLQREIVARMGAEQGAFFAQAWDGIAGDVDEEHRRPVHDHHVARIDHTHADRLGGGINRPRGHRSARFQSGLRGRGWGNLTRDLIGPHQPRQAVQLHNRLGEPWIPPQVPQIEQRVVVGRRVVVHDVLAGQAVDHVRGGPEK